jgi:hypothetical protein
MTTLLTVLLILATVTLLTPRGVQARAEIRAAAAVAGWRAVAPAARHLAVHALLLLVEVLRLIHKAATLAAQILAIAAACLERAQEVS